MRTGSSNNSSSGSGSSSSGSGGGGGGAAAVMMSSVFTAATRFWCAPQLSTHAHSTAPCMHSRQPTAVLASPCKPCPQQASGAPAGTEPPLLYTVSRDGALFGWTYSKDAAAARPGAAREPRGGARVSGGGR